MCNKEKPLVSVIMPSYNTPRQYLIEAVRSVLCQTYSEFELLIIDDGSKVLVQNEIAHIVDSRVRVLVNPGNQGLSYSLNRGLRESAGKYIFRMDSDDKCVPNRLEKQIEYLEKHPDVAVVSTFAHTFGALDLIYRSSSEDSQIKAELLWKNPIVHPTVALRASAVKDDDIEYSTNYTSEDYEIWSRLAFERQYKFAVISDELLYYRLHDGQITVTKHEKLLESEARILGRSFRQLGIAVSDHELDTYCKLRKYQKMDRDDLMVLSCMLKKVLDCKSKNISMIYLKKIYQKAIVRYCVKNKTVLGLKILLKL